MIDDHQISQLRNVITIARMELDPVEALLMNRSTHDDLILYYDRKYKGNLRFVDLDVSEGVRLFGVPIHIRKSVADGAILRCKRSALEKFDILNLFD